MSAIENKVFVRFKKMGQSALHLSENDAEMVAAQIQACYGPLMGFGNLCISPDAYKIDISNAILRRWLSAAPLLLPVAEIFMKSPGAQRSIKEVNSLNLEKLRHQVVKIGIEKCALSESTAKTLSVHVSESASTFFALQQACMGCEDYLLKDLAEVLRSALREPLNHLLTAKSLYFSS